VFGKKIKFFLFLILVLLVDWLVGRLVALPWDLLGRAVHGSILLVVLNQRDGDLVGWLVNGEIPLEWGWAGRSREKL